MSAMAYQITSTSTVCSAVCSGEGTHQRSVLLAFVRGIHRWPVHGFPSQMASNAENVSIWWRHYVKHYSWLPVHKFVAREYEQGQQPLCNIKVSSHQQRKSHCGVLVRSFYPHTWLSYTSNTESLHWPNWISPPGANSNWWPLKSMVIKISHLFKIFIFQWARYMCLEFQRFVLNSPQNILPIYSKIRISYNNEILWPFRFEDLKNVF